MSFVRLITYNEPASSYLVVITEPAKSFADIPKPILSFYVVKGDRIAVSEQVYKLLLKQGHIDIGKLQLVT